MLCIPIVGPTLEAASRQISQANALGNVLEVRLDLLQAYTLEDLARLCKEITLPVIFSLRKKSQGGHFKGSQQEPTSFSKQQPPYRPQALLPETS